MLTKRDYINSVVVHFKSPLIRCRESHNNRTIEDVSEHLEGKEQERRSHTRI